MTAQSGRTGILTARAWARAVVCAIFTGLLLLLLSPVPQAFAYIANGATAIDMLGNYDDSLSDPQPVYTKGAFTLNNYINRLGLSNTPTDIEIDHRNHRLYVADQIRVLVYELDSNDQLIDRVPDYVLGKPNFYSTAAEGPSVTAYNIGTISGQGLAFSSGSNLLYVADTSYSRVLVFDVETINNGEPAVHVLGQKRFSTYASVTSAAGMSAPYALALDDNGNRLFVADNYARVLVFDVSTITNGEEATGVLGQPAFNTSSAALTQAGMGSPRSLAYDPDTNLLYVGDITYHRVTIFDVATVTNGENAAYILGQSSYGSSSCSISQTSTCQPYGLSLDTAGDRLFVSQSNHNRVTVFDISTITNNEAAQNVLGQPDYATSSTAYSITSAPTPYGSVFDPVNQYLYVANTNGDRIGVFDVTGISNNEPMVDLLGQTDEDTVDPQPRYNKSGQGNGPNKFGLNSPFGSIAVDTVNDRLFMADTGNNRVLVYNLNGDGSLTDHLPDYVLGQPDFATGASLLVSQSEMYGPISVAVDSTLGLIYVADSSNNRILVFSGALSNGMNAWRVLGQSTFTTRTTGTTQSTLSNPYGVAASGSLVFVSDYGNNRIMVFSGALSNGMNAWRVLGQANFTSASAATTAAGLSLPFSVSYDDDNQRLFIADFNNHRVLVHSTSALTNGQSASNVLGQSLFTTSSTGRSQTAMYGPTGVGYDPFNNRLFVSELYNGRATAFDVTSISDGEPAQYVLGKKNFTQATGNELSQDEIYYYSYGIGVDSAHNKVYANDYYASRILVFDSAPTTSTALIEGTVYDSDGSTPLTSKLVTIAVNGASAGSGTTNGSGEYGISIPVYQSGGVVLAYLDGETEKGGSATLGPGGSLSGLNIRRNRLTMYTHTGSWSYLDTMLLDDNGDTDVTDELVYTPLQMYMRKNRTFAVASGATVDAYGLYGRDVIVNGNLGLRSSSTISGSLLVDHGSLTNTAAASYQVSVSGTASFLGGTFSPGPGTTAFYGGLSLSGTTVNGGDGTVRIGPEPGLYGTFYDGTNFNTYYYAFVDPSIKFSPDDTVAIGSNRAGGTTTYSARWVGQVRANYSETYTFYFTTDDGARLWVDGTLIYNSWTDQGEVERSGTIALQAGRWYDILFEHYNNGGPGAVSLSYSSASEAKKIIPPTNLRNCGPTPCPGKTDFIHYTQTGGTVRDFGGTLQVRGSGAFQLSRGSFTATGGTIRVSGDFTNNGNITTSGTLFLEPNARRTLETGTGIITNVRLNDGLAAYWKFDERNGYTSIAADDSGNGNDLTLYLGPSTSSDIAPTGFPNSGSLVLDGSTQYAQVTDSATYNDKSLRSNTVTIALWVKKLAHTNYGTYVSKNRSGDTDTGTSWWQLMNYSTTGRFAFRVTEDEDTLVSTAGSAVGLNTWNHVAATYDGTRARIYINGKLDNSTTLSVIPAQWTTQLYVGRRTDGYYPNSQIDDLRIYNRALTDAEIAALAGGTSAPGTGTGTVTLSGALNVRSDVVLDTGTLDTGSSNAAISLSGAWLNRGGIFLPRGGTVTMRGTGSRIVLHDGQRFHTLILSGGTVHAEQPLAVSGALTVRGGTVFNMSGGVTVRAGSLRQLGGRIQSRSGTIIMTNAVSGSLLLTNTGYNLRIENPMESGLIGYWKMDEQQSPVRDFSRVGNAGIVRGAVWSGAFVAPTTYPNRSAMYFDGSNDFVAMPDHSEYTRTTGYTVSAWIWRIGSSGHVAGQWGNTGAGNAAWRMDISSGYLRMGNHNGSSTSNLTDASTSLSAGRWYHVAAVYSGGTSGTNGRLYVNGNEVTSGTITAIPQNSSYDLTAGIEATISNAFNGYIDDVRVYDRPLSAWEIKNLGNGRYAHGNSGTTVTTLQAPLNLSGSLSIDAGKLATNDFDVSVKNALNVTGGSFSGSTANLTVNGNVFMSTGATIIAPTGWFRVNGNWENESGSLLPRTGTVTLIGVNQYLSGSTTFANLTKIVTSADTLQFEAGKTQYVTGNLTLSGSSAVNVLSLRSTQTGVRWFINPTGIRNVSYLDVKDSKNTDASLITCTDNCVNSGNNSGWNFGYVIAIYGTVFNDAGITNIGANKTVAVSVNGNTADSTAETTSTGSYYIGGLTYGPDDVLALYLDDETENALTVSVGTNSDMTGADLWRDHVIVRCDNTCEASSTLLDTANDNGDADITALMTNSGDVLSLYKLNIPSGQTFRPASRVTVTDDVSVEGTLKMPIAPFVVGGDFTMSGGIITHSGTLVMKGANSKILETEGQKLKNLVVTNGLVSYWKFDETTSSPSATTDASGYGHSGTYVNSPSSSATSAPVRFGNARSIDLNGSTQYLYVPDAETPTGDFTFATWIRPDTVNDEMIAMQADGSGGDEFYWYINGSNKLLANTNSILRATSSASIAPGMWTHIAVTRSGSAITQYINGIVDGTGSDGTAMNFSTCHFLIGVDADSGCISSLGNYYDGKIDDFRVYDYALTAVDIAGLAAGNQPATGTGTVTLSGALSVAGDLRLNAGTLDVSSNDYGITLSGSWMNQGGKFSPRHGTVTLDGNAAAGKYIQDGGQRFNNLTIASDGGTGVWRQNDRLNLSGALTLSNGTLDASQSGTFAIRTKTLSTAGGTYTRRNGTIILSNHANATLSLPTRVSRLRIEDTKELGLIGYWKMDEGQEFVRDWSGQEHHGMILGGATWTGATLPPLTFDNPHAMRFDGTNDYIDIGASTTHDPQNLTVSAWIYPDWNGTYNYVVSKEESGSPYGGYMLRKENSDFEFVIGVGSTEYSTTWTSNVPTALTWSHVAGTYDGETARLYVNGSLVASNTSPSGSLRQTTAGTRLLIGESHGWPGRYFKGSIDDVRIYNRALPDTEIRALADGRYASMSGSGASSVQLSAPLLASGAFMLDSGSFDAAGYPVVIQGSGSVYAGTYQTGTAYSVFSGGLVNAGDFISSSATIDINGGFTNLTGSFLAPRNANMTVAGNWLKQAGTFKNNSGTVVFDGADQTISGSTVFGNLQKSVSVERTLTFAAGTTQTITGSMLLHGSPGQRLFLLSSTNGMQAYVDPQGSRSVQYLNVQDNNNSNVTSISCLTSCIDSGNNTNWDFGTAVTGKFFTDEGYTPAASKTVALSVNGAAAGSTDTTDSNGNFSLAVTSYPAGSVLATYSDGNGSDYYAVTVTIGTGGSLSGVNLFAKRLIARSDSGSYPLTNSHLATSDNNGDTDITSVYAVYSTGSVVNSNYELLVWTGALFTPGSNVTAGSIDVRGTMTMSGYTARSLSAFAVKNGGVFNSSGTVLMSTDGSGPGISAPFIATAGSPVHDLAINDGLVGYWTMDDFPNTDTVADRSGFGRHGTLSGGMTLTNSNLPSTIRSRNRSAASFDDTDDSIHFEQVPISRPFTFATWWYGTGNYNQWRDLLSPSQDYGPHIDTSNVLMWYDAGANNANTILQLGRWYHLATTIDASGNLTHYVNGDADGTHANEGSKMKAWNRIGYYNEPSASILDDVRLYNRALSAVEIASLAAGTGPATSNTTTSLSGAVTVSGDFTLAGGILDATSSNFGLTVSGSWLNHGGILYSRSGSIVLDGSGHLLTGGTDAGRFNDLTIDGTGNGKRIMDDRLSASGTVTLSSGTFDMGSGASIRAQSVLQSGGTFVSRSGAIILDGDQNGSIGITDPIGGLSLESNKVDDLVLHWTFNEGQRRAFDRSNHGNHGTLNGGPVWSGATVASRIQYENVSALQFDGADDYVVSPNLRNHFPDDSVTMSVWFYPTNGGIIVSELGTATPNTSYHDSNIEVLSNGTTYVRVWNLTAVNVGTATMNAWNHVVLRYRDGGDLLDGFLNGVQSSSQSTGDRDAPWNYGYGVYYALGPIDSTNSGDGTYYNGMMDDFRVYNRALTNEEVSKLYRGGFAAGSSGSTVWKQTSDLDINGNLKLIGGRLNASLTNCSGVSCDIALRGNLFNTAGTGAFIPQAGTVTLDGMVQTLTGSTTFAGLSKSTASGTLFLDPNAIFTITGSLLLQGATNQLMKIRSSAGSGTSYPLGQTPLKSPVSSASDYNMGYRFTPRTDGYITALGARCTAATRTVRLYTCDDASCSTGTEQRSATVYTGNLHEWAYTKISPYAVTADTDYVVSVRGNPWCYVNYPTPFEVGGVTVQDSRYISASNNIPTSVVSSVIYGQADVQFVGKHAELALTDGGSQTIDHLDVADNDASVGSSLNCSSSSEGCVDSSNNLNWLFGDTRITGRVLEYDRVTPAVGKRVAVSVNGGAAEGIGYSDAGGMYDINGISSFTGGAVVTVYMDNNANNYYGSTVFLSSGSSMTGADLYRYWLTARSESGGAVMTNQHFRYADNGDADLQDTLLISAEAPYRLYTSDFLAWSGTTVRLEGGSLYTGYSGGNGKLHLDGNLDANGNAVIVNWIYSQSGGTFTSGTGAITMFDDYVQDGGTFIAPEATTLVLGDDFYHSGGIFEANSGTVLLNHSAGATVTGSGVTFHNVTTNHAQYGLYNYWPFDELTGSRAQDISGYANSGNLIGATFTDRAAPTRWDNKGSAYFDGNDYILVSDSAYTDPSYMTISVWVRVTGGNGTYRTIISKPSSTAWTSPYAYYNIRLNSSNRIEAWFNTPTGSNILTSSSSVTADSKWHHIAYKVYAGSQALFLDGQLEASASVNSSISNSSQPLVIGVHNAESLAEYWTGDIDDLRIYYYNLSDSEIRALASGGQPSGTYYTTFSGAHIGISGDAMFHTPVTLGNPETVLTVSGSWINNGGIFDSASGTVVFNGSGVIRTGGPEGSFHNVVIDGTGDGKRVLNDRLLLSGALTINSGTLNMGNERSIHTRILRQNGGTVEGSGTIVFDRHGAMSGSTLITSPNSIHIEDPVGSGLQAYWKFDERGGSAIDHSGRGNTVTLNNGAQWSGSTIAPVGFDNVAALRVDGTNDYASIGNFGSFTHMTVSAWIYRTGSTASRESIISYKESGNCGFLLNLNENGSSQYPNVWLYRGSWVQAQQSTAVSTNTWTHLAATYDGTNLLLYRDGVLVASTATSGNMTQCSANTSIGSRNSFDQHWFPGLIDDLRIYGRALSAQEISAIAKGGYPLGWSGSTTMALGNGPFNVSGSLQLYNGNLHTGAATPVFENRLILNQNNGRYIGGSGLQTFNGGMSLSGATLTAGAGSLDINGILNLSGATLNRGTGLVRASGYTRIGKGSTVGRGSAEAKLVIDGTTTLENETNYANLGHIQIGSSPDTVTLSGNLLVDKLTVGTGDTLISNGYDMVVGTGGLYLHGTLDTQVAGGRSTTLVLSGSWIASGTGDLISGSAAVILAGKGNHTLSSSGTFRRLVLDNGLVGYWKLDDSNGGTARDSSRFRSHGTLNSIPTGSSWVSGHTGANLFFNNGSLDFNGSSSYVDMGSPDLGITNNVTVAFWINPDTGNGVIMSQGYNYSGNEYGWAVHLGTEHFAATNDRAILWTSSDNSGNYNGSAIVQTSANVIGLGTWQHVAITKAGTSIRIYINGVQRTSGSISASEITYNGGKNLTLGKQLDGSWFYPHFNGRLDDVRIYNRALNASEIATLYGGYPSTGSGVYAMGSPLSVSGSFVNQTATLNNAAGSYPIHLTGSWMNTGDYSAGTSTVYLSGRQSQTMSGNTVFYNLAARTNGANRTIYFDHSGRQSMSGSLVLQGVGGNTLSIRSTRSGSGARILLDGDSGSQTIDHLNVQDSNASSGATLVCSAIAENCTDSGNNTNWDFSEPAAVERKRDTFMFVDF